MAYLSPKVVAGAARALFRQAHPNFFAFLCLKAAGITTENFISVRTESSGDEFDLLALQPEGFDAFVAAHRNQFTTDTSLGLPTNPQGQSTPNSTYSLYFPITDKPRFLIRKSDSWRGSVQTQIKEVLDGKTQTGSNIDRANKSNIYDVRLNPDNERELQARLKPMYEDAVRWNLSIEGQPLHIPMRELAIWLYRNDDLDTAITIEMLVEEAVRKLNLTPVERDAFFNEETGVKLSPDDFVQERDNQIYFAALCLPAGGAVEPLAVAQSLPLSPASAARLAQKAEMTSEQFYARADTLGLRIKMPELLPENATPFLVNDYKFRNILLYGPPRTGKSYEARRLAAKYLGIEVDKVEGDPRFTQVQFHLGWGYGDFIRKLTPKASSTGGLTFELQNGAFLDHCLKHPEERSVFVIEELNRAVLAQVLGEAFQVIEEGYRGHPVALPATLQDPTIKTLTVPKELLIIATVNNVDVSTQPLDLALLERFASVEVPYRSNEVYTTLKKVGWNEEQAESFVGMLDEAAKITGFPLGHALFYGIKGPETAERFYRAKVRPVLDFFLNRFDKQKLEQVDQLVEDCREIWTSVSPVTSSAPTLAVLESNEPAGLFGQGDQVGAPLQEQQIGEQLDEQSY